MKKIIIMLVLTLILGVGGYYYWEIYRVPGVALELILIFQKNFGEAMKQVEASRPKDSDDYEPILNGIETAQKDFERIDKELSSLWLPSTLKEIYEAMREMVQTLSVLMAKAGAQARFMSDLSGMLRALIPKEMNKTLGPNATVGDLANMWNNAIPEVKSKGNALFGGKTVELKGTTFEELTSKWNEARDSFDVVLVFIRAQNQKMPAQNFNIDRMQMTERERAAFTKVGSFLELVEKTVDENSAYDIMLGENVADKSFQENLQAESAHLEKAFQKFSEENPNIVKKIEAEAQKRGLK